MRIRMPNSIPSLNLHDAAANVRFGMFPLFAAQLVQQASSTCAGAAGTPTAEIIAVIRKSGDTARHE